MTLPQFFVEDLGRDDVALSTEDSHHALRALRLRPGDEVSLADGRGSLARARLRDDRDGVAVATVEERRRVVRRSPLVSVALAPPKGDRLAWAVQKLAELGVDEIVLTDTERAVRSWPEGRAERAEGRLRTVAREAAMQSRQPFVPEVRLRCPLDVATDGAGAAVVGLFEGATTPLSSVLPEEAGGVRLLVGPEGGFTDTEVETMRGRGAELASLGPGILRTETAAIVGAALVLARYGRLG